MGISAKKTKLMTNNNSINKKIKVDRQKLETVTDFKYLGSVVYDEDPKPEILSRIAQMTADQFGTTGAFLPVPRYTADVQSFHIHFPVCL